MAPLNLNASADAPYFTPRHATSPGTPFKLDEKTPTLFTPLKMRGIEVRNRIMVAPMCQYSTAATGPEIGQLTDWHIATLGHYAMKGAGTVFIEATGVQPNGRISPNCPGIWDDAQIAPMKRVVDFIHTQGGAAALQLAHAGRKASTCAPWVASQYRRAKNLGPGVARATEDVGGWPNDVVGPMGGPEETWDGISPEDEAGGFFAPRALTEAEIGELVLDFGRATVRAVKAGIDIIEIHAAHGYLLHQFLSPVVNRRTDKYGGSYEGRTRILKEVITEVRRNMPDTMPLMLRISYTDWLEGSDIEKQFGGSWDYPSSERLAKELPDLGVDMLDVSSGGNHPKQNSDPFSDKSYQTARAGTLRKAVKETGKPLLLGAVGLIREAERARDIVQDGVVGSVAETISEEAQTAKSMTEKHEGKTEPLADVVLIGRQFMREPEWVLKVAKELSVEVAYPSQFLRVKL